MVDSISEAKSLLGFNSTGFVDIQKNRVCTQKYLDELKTSLSTAESVWQLYQKTERDWRISKVSTKDKDGTCTKYRYTTTVKGVPKTTDYKDIYAVHTGMYDKDGPTRLIETPYVGRSTNSYLYNFKNLPIGVTDYNYANYSKFEYYENALVAGVDEGPNGHGKNFDYTCIVETNDDGTVSKTTEQMAGMNIVSDYKYENGKLTTQKTAVENGDDSFVFYVDFDEFERPVRVYKDNKSNDSISDASGFQKALSMFFNDDEDMIYEYTYGEYGEDGPVKISWQEYYFTTEQKETLDRMH